MLGLHRREVGDNWEEWRDKLHYFDYAVVAADPGLVVYLLIRRRRGSGPTSDAEAPADRAEARPSAATEAWEQPVRSLAGGVLGAVQGPAELLPVSSSAHLTLIPWLAGWDWDDAGPRAAKSFEVALHAGAAAALLIGQRQVIAEELAPSTRRKAPSSRSPSYPRARGSPSSGRSSGASVGRCRPPPGC